MAPICGAALSGRHASRPPCPSHPTSLPLHHPRPPRASPTPRRSSGVVPSAAAAQPPSVALQVQVLMQDSTGKGWLRGLTTSSTTDLPLPKPLPWAAATLGSTPWPPPWPNVLTSACRQASHGGAHSWGEPKESAAYTFVRPRWTPLRIRGTLVKLSPYLICSYHRPRWFSPRFRACSTAHHDSQAAAIWIRGRKCLGRHRSPTPHAAAVPAGTSTTFCARLHG